MIQENMFALVDKGFCFDSDINNIVAMLDDIFQGKEMITKIEKDWSVWSHVPQCGYRLSYYVNFNKPLPNSLLTELDKVTKYGMSRRIEVKPFGYNFSDYDSTGSMSIYSIYKDERRKMKKGRYDGQHNKGTS